MTELRRDFGGRHAQDFVADGSVQLEEQQRKRRAVHGVGFNLAFQFLAVDHAGNGIGAGGARETLIELRHLLAHLRRHGSRFLAQILNQAAQCGGLQGHHFRKSLWVRRVRGLLHLLGEIPQAAAIEFLAVGQIFNDIAQGQNSALQLQAALNADLLGDGGIILQFVL